MSDEFGDSMKKHALITNALIVAMLFLVMSSVVNVNAQTTTTGDDDDDEHDDGTTETENEDSNDDSNERGVEVQVSPNQVQIESRLESGENEDSFNIEVSTGSDGVDFKVSYETETGGTETGNEFEVEFQEIVEYIDSNDNGVYDNEVDNDTQVMKLMNFQPIIYTVENRTEGDVHIFDISTTDGVFTAVAYIPTDFIVVNGTVVAPSQMKIDIIIDGFNYTDTSSQLALMIKLHSQTETSHDDETEDEEDGRATDETEVDFTMTGFNGFFSWVETAVIDGVEYPVNSSIDEVSSGETNLYLNYAHGELIIHDPKIGFENILIDTNGNLSFDNILASGYLPLIAIGAIAALLLIIIIKRR